MRGPLFAALGGLAAFGFALARANTSGLEAVIAVEDLRSSDVHLRTGNLSADWTPAASQHVLSTTADRIAIDYAPASTDIVSQSVARTEDRFAADLTMRIRTERDFSPFAGGGAYSGFTDFRSVWLDEYYRQLFEGVPGYVAVSPKGWHALAGGRWAYVPGSAFLQGTIVWQDDTVSPGYEPQIGQPLRRGRERLYTTAVRVSTENVLAPTVRTLWELSATNTTGRDTRYAARGSVNWSVSDRLTLRAVAAGVREQPAFHALSAALTLEYDWSARWFAGITVRGYRDSGEVVDPLLVSSAAPALRTKHVVASLRWQGERLSVRVEGGPYHSRYDEIAIGSAQFARLYIDRNWRRVQAALAWKF